MVKPKQFSNMFSKKDPNTEKSRYVWLKFKTKPVYKLFFILLLFLSKFLFSDMFSSILREKKPQFR